MKLEIERQDFLKVWQTAEKLSASKTAKDSTKGVLISASDDSTVTLEATDLNTSIRCKAKGVNVIEPGKGKIQGVPDVLFAIGVGFPAQSPNVKNTNIVTADYVANVVAQNEYDFTDWYDDDEDVEE